MLLDIKLTQILVIKTLNYNFYGFLAFMTCMQKQSQRKWIIESDHILTAKVSKNIGEIKLYMYQVIPF